MPTVGLMHHNPPGAPHADDLAQALVAPTPKQPKPPFGDDIGGGVLRRPGPPPAHVPKPKPSPGGIEDQGGSSRGGLGQPRYGVIPARTGGIVARPNPKAKLGSGGRFAAFVDRLVVEGKSQDSARAIAASAGRKAHGSAQMAKWSAKGRK